MPVTPPVTTTTLPFRSSNMESPSLFRRIIGAGAGDGNIILQSSGHGANMRAQWDAGC
jgi:hypothetical protein